MQTEGLRRRGKRLLEGKAAVHIGDLRCARSARARSTHLHASHHIDSTLLNYKITIGAAARSHGLRGLQLPL